MLLSSLFLGCDRSREGELDVRQWNDLISQTLPAGSSRSNVEKFLDERKIPHSFIARSNFPEEANTIVAFIKSNDKGVVKKAGMQLKFRFDADQRLVSSECKEIFTGP